MTTLFHILVNLGAVCGVLLYAVWCALPHFCGDAGQALALQTPMRTYRDAYGNVLLREPTFDWQCRVDVPLSAISPHVVRVMLAVEDYGFYHHDGVDRLAAFRSLWMNLRHGGVMSGASTLTMQLAGMTLGRERTLKRKLLQAGRARRLEWTHGKDWILENYLNRVPFGGRVHGIEAAGQMYFGVSARHLQLAEATLLCGLPQRPSALRPDRHPQRARRRQRMVLWMLEQRGCMTAEEACALYCGKPLLYRDFTRKNPLEQAVFRKTEHYLQAAKAEAGGALSVSCAMDCETQRMLLRTLRQAKEPLAGVADGAGIVLDNATSRVLALVGTLDYAEKNGGQVNVAARRRTAGSALKPFIYAEAIDGGLICASTVLQDTPLRYGIYAPGNYDGLYSGGVSAADALSASLNTPAVRLVARLGAARVLEMFGRLGLHRFDGVHGDRGETARRLGLSLSLGTGGYRLTDMAAAYMALARGGVFAGLAYLQDDERREGIRIFSKGTADMVTDMLSSRRLPGFAQPCAWKTGTSSGNRDAWCFAYTREFTVGIWFGNKNGRGSSALVGVTAAAPAASAVMNALYHGRGGEPLHDESGQETTALCARTGLRARQGICPEHRGKVVEGVPLRICQTCLSPMQGQRRVRILKPLPNRYLAGKKGSVTLPLKADRTDVHWYVDGLYAGMMSNGRRMEFGRGVHLLKAVSEHEGVLPGTIRFEVE